MRRLGRLLVGLLGAFVVGGVAAAAVDVASLRTADVVIEDGAPYGTAERDRLQSAADDLRARDFPVKFVVLAKAAANADITAARLRGDLAREIGEDKVDAVFVLGPRQLGIAGTVFQSERLKAFEDERATLERDPIQGTINVAKRLQDCDAIAAIDEPCGRLDGRTAKGGGLSGGLIALLIGVLAVGVLAFSFARRAAKRGEARKAREDDRAVFSPMLDILSAQITDLGDEVGTEPNAERAKARYDEALAAYAEVRDALAAEAPFDADRMRGRVRDGIQAALAARSLLDGKPEPQTHEPVLSGLCTFDPQHGRAMASRRIVTPSGDGAEVPVCASCAAGLDAGQTPALRLVQLGGEQQPYWRIQGLGNMFDANFTRDIAGMLERAMKLHSDFFGR